MMLLRIGGGLLFVGLVMMVVMLVVAGDVAGQANQTETDCGNLNFDLCQSSPKCVPVVALCCVVSLCESVCCCFTHSPRFTPIHAQLLVCEPGRFVFAPWLQWL